MEASNGMTWHEYDATKKISPGPNMSEGYNLQVKAMGIVRAYVEVHLEVTDEVPDFDVYVVWFSKVLQNWKALVSTTLPDGMYYEVTYNGHSGETYVDAYKKFNNVCIKD